MSCDWEGNRRSGVALVMRRRLKWFIHLRAQGLSNRNEHPTNTLHGVWYSLRYPKRTDRLTDCRPIGLKRNKSTMWHLNPSSRLAKADMGRKFGGYTPHLQPPFLGGRWGLCLHLTQCVRCRGLPACQVSSVQPFGHSTPTSRT